MKMHYINCINLTKVHHEIYNIMHNITCNLNHLAKLDRTIFHALTTSSAIMMCHSPYHNLVLTCHSIKFSVCHQQTSSFAEFSPYTCQGWPNPVKYNSTLLSIRHENWVWKGINIFYRQNSCNLLRELVIC